MTTLGLKCFLFLNVFAKLPHKNFTLFLVSKKLLQLFNLSSLLRRHCNNITFRFGLLFLLLGVHSCLLLEDSLFFFLELLTGSNVILYSFVLIVVHHKVKHHFPWFIFFFTYFHDCVVKSEVWDDWVEMLVLNKFFDMLQVYSINVFWFDFVLRLPKLHFIQLIWTCNLNISTSFLHEFLSTAFFFLYLKIIIANRTFSYF